MVVVPGGQADVEPRIVLDQIAMDRPDLLQLAVRRRQQRVQDFQPQVLLGGRHDVALLPKRRKKPTQVTQAVSKQKESNLRYSNSGAALYH